MFLILVLLCRGANDDCENELKNLYTELCVDLNDYKKRLIAMKRLICERSKSMRDLYYTSDSDPNVFQASLSEDDFYLWSVYYHDVDSVCISTSSSIQNQKNIEKMMHIIDAVQLSTISLKKIHDINQELYSYILNTTESLSFSMREQLEAEESMISNISNALSTVNSAADTISKLKQKALDYGIYILGSLFGTVLSLVIPLMAKISIFMSIVWSLLEPYGSSNFFIGVLFCKSSYILVYIICILVQTSSSLIESIHYLWEDKRNYLRVFH